MGNPSEIKYVKLSKTVIVTVEGKTYAVSSSHPLYQKIVEAIDSNQLEEITAIVEHSGRQDFLNRLKLKPK